jgi:hypothetical protein
MATNLPMPDRATHARRALDQRQLVGLEFAQLGQRGIRQLLGADVLDDAAQVAQLAFGIDEAGFFFARVAISNEFHACFLLS